MRKIISLAMLLVPLVAFPATKTDLGNAIKEKYVLTTRSMLSGQVKKPGTVFYVAKQGLQANKPSTVLKSTVINDGELEQLGGGSFIPGDAGRTLEIGDQMYLYTYQVKDDGVAFLLGTVNSYETQVRGSTKLQPYQLALQFQYSSGLAAVDAQRVMDDFSSYFSTEKEVAASSDKTLKLGLTPDEVIAILGTPKQKVDLGSKQIYTYDDLKVIFQDGAVTDVQ